MLFISLVSSCCFAVGAERNAEVMASTASVSARSSTIILASRYGRIDLAAMSTSLLEEDDDLYDRSAVQESGRLISVEPLMLNTERGTALFLFKLS